VGDATRLIPRTMASLIARHSKGCALGKGRRTEPHPEGCTCTPTYHMVIRDERGPRAVSSRTSAFINGTKRVSAGVIGVVLKVFQAASRRAATVVFDRGIETAGNHISIDHFHPERVWYSPSSWTFLRRGLQGLDIHPADVFVDFGCGKGRVLYQAAHYPFARVVGIEISPEISQIALRNLEHSKDRFHCGVTEVITGDVLEFEIPDDLRVAYFYDPFVGDTFRRVIDNITDSIDRHPRQVRIIYVVPVMADYILATGRFKLRRSVRVVHENIIERLAIFETVEMPLAPRVWPSRT
jgi:methyltransferase family protein